MGMKGDTVAAVGMSLVGLATDQPQLGGPRYDVCVGRGQGGHGKVDIVREVARILYCKSVPKADKRGGGQKI